MSPVVIDEHGQIAAGNARAEARQILRFQE
jgi:hypothetical protein